MRIVGFEVFPVANPNPSVGGPVWMFVRLDTDAGISGYGEIFTSSLYSRPMTVAQIVADLVEQFAIGRDPADLEKFFFSIYNSHYTRSPDLAKLAMASGIELAMWDILGKSLGRPVHALMGGRMRDRVRMYSYISPPRGVSSEEFWADSSAISSRCAELVDLGFTALKLDPFPLLTGEDSLAGQFVPVQPTERQLDGAERIVGAVRSGVGSRAAVIVGTHGQFTAAGAIRVATRLERFDPMWFEEPVPPDHPAEMAKVAAATRIPIAAGERLGTKFQVAELIRHGAAGIVNLDVTQVGGLLESRKIAALAEANAVQITPHVFGGPLSAAASLQLALTLPNLLIMEGNGVYDGAYAELLETPLMWRNGYLYPSDRPGMGHDLDESVARAWAVTDQQLQYVRLAVDYR
jgi:L-alanine-DL-glutamate epimerase-like enolase superfamily enzyme